MNPRGIGQSIGRTEGRGEGEELRIIDRTGRQKGSVGTDMSRCVLAKVMKIV